DGILRRVPLITSAQGKLLPGFDAEIVAVAQRLPSILVQTGTRGVEHVVAGKLVAPTDGSGHAVLHYAPPLLRYLSAADILNPAFETNYLSGRIVLLGITGLGVVDQKLSPLGLMEGVQVHAQLIQSILEGSLLHRPFVISWLELLVTFGAGLMPMIA